MIFPFKKKGFPRKFLYYCVVVLSLYLLKFIYSYVEFFPTLSSIIGEQGVQIVAWIW